MTQVLQWLASFAVIGVAGIAAEVFRHAAVVTMVTAAAVPSAYLLPADTASALPPPRPRAGACSCPEERQRPAITIPSQKPPSRPCGRQHARQRDALLRDPHCGALPLSVA
jgi:hypothetical protein